MELKQAHLKSFKTDICIAEPYLIVSVFCGVLYTAQRRLVEVFRSDWHLKCCPRVVTALEWYTITKIADDSLQKTKCWVCFILKYHRARWCASFSYKVLQTALLKTNGFMYLLWYRIWRNNDILLRPFERYSQFWLHRVLLVGVRKNKQWFRK